MRRALIIAFGLGLLAAPVAAKIEAFPAGFHTEDVKTNGTTLHVRVGGHGPAVVMLHGFGDSGDMWAPVAAVLAKDHTVVVWDPARAVWRSLTRCMTRSSNSSAFTLRRHRQSRDARQRQAHNAGVGAWRREAALERRSRAGLPPVDGVQSPGIYLDVPSGPFYGFNRAGVKTIPGLAQNWRRPTDWSGRRKPVYFAALLTEPPPSISELTSGSP